MSIYTEIGYDNRKQYLDGLAEDYGVDTETVYMIASLLGPNEDFDGLVTELDDYSQQYGEAY